VKVPIAQIKSNCENTMQATATPQAPTVQMSIEIVTNPTFTKNDPILEH
jgi:hypothetical protein